MAARPPCKAFSCAAVTAALLLAAAAPPAASQQDPFPPVGNEVLGLGEIYISPNPLVEKNGEEVLVPVSGEEEDAGPTMLLNRGEMCETQPENYCADQNPDLVNCHCAACDNAASRRDEIGGGGDPYINVAGDSIFLDAPPRSDVLLYGRSDGVNVTLTTDDKGTYFVGARIEWGQHLLLVEGRLVSGALPEAVVTLDGVRLVSSDKPIVVGGVELFVSPTFVDAKAQDTLAVESFRIFATHNNNANEANDAHIDFAVKNKGTQLFDPTLPPAFGLLADMLYADALLSFLSTQKLPSRRRALLDDTPGSIGIANRLATPWLDVLVGGAVSDEACCVCESGREPGAPPFGK